MTISTNIKLKKMINYIKSKGWTQEYVILNNIICSVERCKKQSVSFLELINNYDSSKARDYFHNNFKKFTRNRDGSYSGILLYNVWDAFDSSVLHSK